MITWKTTTDSKKRTSFEAEGASTAEDVHDALVEVWQKALGELAARCPEKTWEILICQTITQCGIVVVFPARKKSGEVVDAAFTVQFLLRCWSEAYEALPEPEEEAKFDKAYDRLHKNQLRALKTAIGDAKLKGKFAALKRRVSFSVFCVDEGETPIRDRMEFLWGNRPPKRDFGTAKELFEHVLRKASLTPDYSMRLRHDKVVAVNWFGHEFTDRYVDLLEEVPNLASLCSDLSDFVLTATRVSPIGVRRLKKLFPRVRLTVVSDQAFENGDDAWDAVAEP